MSDISSYDWHHYSHVLYKQMSEQEPPLCVKKLYQSQDYFDSRTWLAKCNSRSPHQIIFKWPRVISQGYCYPRHIHEIGSSNYRPLCHQRKQMPKVLLQRRSEMKISVGLISNLLVLRPKVCLLSNSISPENSPETQAGLNQHDHDSSSLAEAVLILRSKESLHSTSTVIAFLAGFDIWNDGQIFHLNVPSLPHTAWILIG